MSSMHVTKAPGSPSNTQKSNCLQAGGANVISRGEGRDTVRHSHGNLFDSEVRGTRGVSQLPSFACVQRWDLLSAWASCSAAW